MSEHKTVRCDGETYRLLKETQEGHEVGEPSIVSLVNYAVRQAYNQEDEAEGPNEHDS